MDLDYPEQRDPEYKNPSLAGTINFAPASDLSYLEILSYPDLTHPVQKEGKLDDTSLLDWLSECSSEPCVPATNAPLLSSLGQQSPLGGLRLLFGECSFDTKKGLVLPLQKNSFEIIEWQFRLPKQFLKVMKGKGSRAFKRTSRDHDGTSRTCFVFKFGMFQPSYYQLALCYVASTHITYGLLLSKTQDHQIPALIHTLKSDPSYCCSQPLLLAILLTELVLDSCNERIQHSDRKLNTLEEVMGQHEYANLPKGNPLKLDFIATSRQLNFVGRTVGTETMRLGSMLRSLEKIEEYTKWISESRNIGNEGNGSAANQMLADNDLGMMEHVAYLRNACQVSLLRAEFEAKRTPALIQVVYQFMAHKNANVNIALAEDTSTLARASKKDSAVMRTIAIEAKKDSSAMKTIAILGMFFLPGTFLATVFAMPVFNWDSEGAPVVKAGFKYYWIVAVPLTFLVLLLWVLAILLPWRKWLVKIRPRETKSELDIELAGISS